MHQQINSCNCREIAAHVLEDQVVNCNLVGYVNIMEVNGSLAYVAQCGDGIELRFAY